MASEIDMRKQLRRMQMKFLISTNPKIYFTPLKSHQCHNFELIIHNYEVDDANGTARLTSIDLFAVE